MAERIVLDPTEVASNRTELDITPWINHEGLDWGDAEIAAYMSEQARGEAPVDFRVPNRQVAGGLKFAKTLGGTTTVTARANIQAKIALIQREGGWLKRVTSAGGTVYADVVNATFRATSVSGWDSGQSRDLEAGFTLECIPDFYGPEVTLSDHTETSAAELVFTETGIEGDYPGRVRVVVDEDDAENQRGLIFAFRSRHYSNATTAATKHEAEALDPLDTAAGTAFTGASGGTVVQHTDLSNQWTGVVGTNIGGSTYLTHTGTYRVFARVQANNGTVETRLVWDVGDLVSPAENSPWSIPGTANFYIADLGEIRLNQTPVGSHRWQGQIQARGGIGGEDIAVDKLWFVNTDESMTICKAPPQDSATALTTVARDAFAHTAGTLTGKVAPLGGTWGPTGGTVDVDDFTIDTTNGWAQRTANSDADVVSGRYCRLGAGVADDVQVQADFKATYAGGAAEKRLGIFARYVDTSNWLMAVLRKEVTFAGQSAVYLALYKRVAGTSTLLGEELLMLGVTSYDWRTVKLTVDASGNVAVYEAAQGANFGDAKITVSTDVNLAAGGALDDGGYGIYDANTATTGTNTRLADNFQVWEPDVSIPTADGVIYAGQSAELRWDGIYREDAGGAAYGPMSWIEGDLPRIPPSGLENRTVEVFIKPSRGDLISIPDSGIDDVSARIHYRPSWLFVDN